MIRNATARRGYKYHRGIDEARDLDQGLMFIAFNQDPTRQFATIQRRLDDEPMVDYSHPADWNGSPLA